MLRSETAGWLANPWRKASTRASFAPADELFKTNYGHHLLPVRGQRPNC
jgi:hypothetical protein